MRNQLADTPDKSLHPVTFLLHLRTYMIKYCPGAFSCKLFERIRVPELNTIIVQTAFSSFFFVTTYYYYLDVQLRCSSAKHPKPKMPKRELAQTSDRLTY